MHITVLLRKRKKWSFLLYADLFCILHAWTSIKRISKIKLEFKLLISLEKPTFLENGKAIMWIDFVQCISIFSEAHNRVDSTDT